MTDETESGEKPTRVAEMRAKYLELHTGSDSPVTGFVDPGGVVSENISARQRGGKWDLFDTPMGSPPRVCGRWPGGT